MGSNLGVAFPRHRDKIPGGSLVCIFSIGLRCTFKAWPDGKLEKLALHSGDVMVFDAGVVAHEVADVQALTSPFPYDRLLADHRMSIPFLASFTRRCWELSFSLRQALR